MEIKTFIDRLVREFAVPRDRLQAIWAEVHKPRSRGVKRKAPPIPELQEEIEIACQQRGAYLVLKGTMVAIDQTGERALGYLEPDDGEYVLIREYTDEVRTACERYHLTYQN
jgi:hypothetical protein